MDRNTRYRKQKAVLEATLEKLEKAEADMHVLVLARTTPPKKIAAAQASIDALRTEADDTRLIMRSILDEKGLDQ